MRYASSHKKSGVLAAFFYCITVTVSATEIALARVEEAGTVQHLQHAARQLRLYESRIWQSMLHAIGTRAYVRDPDFLLSLPDFTPEAELDRTIAFLYGGPSTNVCRFPARYQFLRVRLGAPALPLHDCADVIEFRAKAPAAEISLVFANENLAEPASIMGHAFLKLSGHDHSGNQLSHAISFYTETDTVNLPKLLYDSTVKGKPGHFTLAPYYEKIDQYVNKEQRSMWEHPLQLSAAEKELLLLHLVELKQARLTYFFQDYNCATLVYFVLATANEHFEHDGAWITPRALVKRAARAGMVRRAEILTPDRWLVRVLAEQLPEATTRETRQLVLQSASPDTWPHTQDDETFLRLMLATSYNNYAFRQGQLAEPHWARNRAVLDRMRKTNFPGTNLEADDGKNPLFTPPEKQIGFALASVAGQPELRLTFLPVSHSITDDNRQRANENELLLFETALRATPGKGARLDRLTIYGIQALMPFDPLTGGISGRFRIGVERQFDASLDDHHAAYINGALGLTKRLGRDIDVFLLAGGGLGYGRHETYVYGDLQVGAVVREVFDMKSLFTYERIAGQIDRNAQYDRWRFVQSKFIDRNQTMQLELAQVRNGRTHETSASLIYKRLF